MKFIKNFLVFSTILVLCNSSSDAATKRSFEAALGDVEAFRAQVSAAAAMSEAPAPAPMEAVAEEDASRKRSRKEALGQQIDLSDTQQALLNDPYLQKLSDKEYKEAIIQYRLAAAYAYYAQEQNLIAKAPRR
jgi:hypothetical protein